MRPRREAWRCSPRRCLNKGTAFTAEEREALGLTGLLPPVISTLEAQVTCAYAQYQRLPDALSKNIYLTALHDRNEVLFFRLLSEHLREMIPIVNDRTVGLAMEQYHHECRRPRGVYLSIDHPDGIEEAFGNLGAGPGRYRSDPGHRCRADLRHRRLGRGRNRNRHRQTGDLYGGGRDRPDARDSGDARCRHQPGKPAGRSDVSGKPACPRSRRALRRLHRRLRQGRREAVSRTRCCSGKISGPATRRRILEKYRGQIRTFNDDLQGTGAITLAAAVSAMRVCGTLLRNQRIVIFGAGTAGIGIADLIRDVMIE